MSRRPRVVALVLAAGYSSRMGNFKPLASLGASTLIEEAASVFLRAGVPDVRVVVGYRAGELTPLLDRLGIRWVLNADYAGGMFASVLAGVRSFEAGVDGFFLLPCDIALVKPETVRSLLNAFDPDDPKIIHPRFNGVRGHPPLIPASLLGKYPGPDHPGGMRAILDCHESDAVDLDVIDENILLDCDTPSDHRAIEERRSREGIPTEAECGAVWSRCGVSEEVIAHCTLVAELARVLAFHLNLAGLSLNIPLVFAAGRLHDIAKGRPDHAAAGAELLARMGFPRTGAVVAKHSDIEPRGASVDEADLVYFADKCVAQDRLVTLEERFAGPLRRYGDRPDIAGRIRKRREDAERIAARIGAMLGRPAEELIRRYGKSALAVAPGRRRAVILVRHGAVREPGAPKRFIGQLDLLLNGEGLRQAGLLADALRDVPLSAVFCSDLKRSADTAEAIARLYGLPCTARRDLREISMGRWEGLSFEEVGRECPEEYAARGRDIVRCAPPDGENFLDFASRVLPAFHDLLGSTRGNILIVGHAGVNRILLSQALGRSLDRVFEIKQEYGCLNLLVQRHPAFEVKLMNGSPSDFEPFRAELCRDGMIDGGKPWES